MLTQEQLLSFRQSLQKINDTLDFPEESSLVSFLDASISVLENESEGYRPKAKNEKPGGLLDFSSSELPVIVVPDIHGRSNFLLKVLDLKIEGEKSVLQLLDEKKIIVVCVGDAVHGEMRAYDRWVKSYEDWKLDVYAGPSMQEEMRENFAVWQILMKLKNSFPENFHFLKGNHENVTNQDGHGNHSFRKFVLEGQMCCDFIRQVYGDVVLHLIYLWEKALPLCALFSSFAVSHAEPAVELTRDDIINGMDDNNVVCSLTWTGNDDVSENTCRKTLKKLNSKAKSKGVIWFGGHRPVKECKFLLRQKGCYIQLHNPDEMNVAFIEHGKCFDPENGILSL